MAGMVNGRLVAVLEQERGCVQVYSNGHRVASPASAHMVYTELVRRDGVSAWAVLSDARFPERAIYLNRSEFHHCQAIGDDRTAVVLSGCYVEVFEDEAGVMIEMEPPVMYQGLAV